LTPLIIAALASASNLIIFAILFSPLNLIIYLKYP
jgi:hypothetical protein